MKVIYEKRYPPEDGENEEICTEQLLEAAREEYSRLRFRYLPEREAGKKAFIEKVKEFSEEYKYDVRIRQARLCVEAKLSFDHQYNLGAFTRLIGMADDITIYSGINGREFSVRLLYYTHAVLRDGIRVFP